jgi:Sulfotransferase domain
MELTAASRALPSPVRSLARRALVRSRVRGLGPADAVVVSYPKSGSTWLRMVLGMVLSGDELDFESVRRVVPPLGLQRSAPAVLPGGGRLVRSHEPIAHLAPTQPQVIYLVRDGREVAASYYHHEVREGRAPASVPAFVEAFLAARLDGYGTWVDHVRGAQETAGALAPVIVVRYDALRHDVAAEVGRLCTAIGASVSAATIEAACAANTKERMQDKERSSTFLAARASSSQAFVRPDDAVGWQELFAGPAAARLGAGLAPGLAAFGYR